MDDETFSAMLGLFMCSDPWPDSVPREPIERFLDDEAQKRGHPNWVVAYHEHPAPTSPDGQLGVGA